MKSKTGDKHLDSVQNAMEAGFKAGYHKGVEDALKLASEKVRMRNEECGDNDCWMMDKDSILNLKN